MGDRAAQIRAEWFVKCASVVLQARVPSQPPTAAAGKDRKNRWVRPRASASRCRSDTRSPKTPKSQNERESAFRSTKKREKPSARASSRANDRAARVSSPREPLLTDRDAARTSIADRTSDAFDRRSSTWRRTSARRAPRRCGRGAATRRRRRRASVATHGARDFSRVRRAGRHERHEKGTGRAVGVPPRRGGFRGTRSGGSRRPVGTQSPIRLGGVQATGCVFPHAARRAPHASRAPVRAPRG